MAITADGRYRLFINGHWVNDGPARSWPEHYQYDKIEVTSYLRPGANEIRVIARYYDTPTFQHIPQEPGLLVQLDVRMANGKKRTICSDASWQMAEATGWLNNAPRIGVQMEPFESYDARREDLLQFSNAAALHNAESGPWKNLQARDCPLLTRRPVAPDGLLAAHLVANEFLSFTFPLVRILYPGRLDAYYTSSAASALATYIIAPDRRRIRIDSGGYLLTVNGRRGRNGVHILHEGANFIFGVVVNHLRIDNKEAIIRLSGANGCRLQNPIRPRHRNPWCFVPLIKDAPTGYDLGSLMRDGSSGGSPDPFVQKLRDLATQVVDRDSFVRVLGHKAKCLPLESLVTEDPYDRFLTRETIGDAEHLIVNGSAALNDDEEETTVLPAESGDVELVYDLGVQNIGYYAFELDAEVGTQVDVCGVEYMARSGMPQIPVDNRNGLHYVCKDGLNKFVSLKRRSGRYLYLTLRSFRRPVRLRSLRLFESTYPVVSQGRFACSDSRLNRIWEASARTLELCMEDTFTDCPLYEQTLWIGDLRHEALFAYTAFGAADLARRCLILGAQSLERFPLVCPLGPSSWSMPLPAWSFLWVIAVWEHYFYTGDAAFLRRLWSGVKRNLNGARAYVRDDGLFSGRFLNSFDWARTDHYHETVLPMSMFLVGAMDAARKCARVLGDRQAARALAQDRRRMAHALNQFWDPGKRAYPDSIHEDGTVSPCISQHTSILSILFDIVGRARRAPAERNLLDPPAPMVRVGSPFAAMLLYEALERVHRPDIVVRSICDNYLPMLECNATTVWETFATGTLARGEFPTRSHCHGWSAAPVYFLNRIILGIRPVAPGGNAFEISPRIKGLSFAEGASASVQGPVSVHWRRNDDRLVIDASGPDGVSLCYAPNETHRGLAVEFRDARTN